MARAKHTPGTLHSSLCYSGVSCYPFAHRETLLTCVSEESPEQTVALSSNGPLLLLGPTILPLCLLRLISHPPLKTHRQGHRHSTPEAPLVPSSFPHAVLTEGHSFPRYEMSFSECVYTQPRRSTCAELSRTTDCQS